MCNVYFNDKIKWTTGILSESYTYFPKVAYSLSGNAFDLIELITYLARMNLKEIKESNSFNISIRAIH